MYELKMKLITFTLKGRFFLAPSESYSRSGGGLEENPGVQRTSPEHQKDILTNLIPSDIFSKLNKKKVHGFSVYSVNYKTSAIRFVL